MGENADLGSDEEDSLSDGLFGGILNMPLPVPEIISGLDKTTFKSKQKAAKQRG